mgnify:FL=1
MAQLSGEGLGAQRDIMRQRSQMGANLGLAGLGQQTEWNQNLVNQMAGLRGDTLNAQRGMGSEQANMLSNLTGDAAGAGNQWAQNQFGTAADMARGGLGETGALTANQLGFAGGRANAYDQLAGEFGMGAAGAQNQFGRMGFDQQAGAMGAGVGAGNQWNQQMYGTQAGLEEQALGLQGGAARDLTGFGQQLGAMGLEQQNKWNQMGFNAGQGYDQAKLGGLQGAAGTGLGADVNMSLAGLGQQSDWLRQASQLGSGFAEAGLGQQGRGLENLANLQMGSMGDLGQAQMQQGGQAANLYGDLTGQGLGARQGLGQAGLNSWQSLLGGQAGMESDFARQMLGAGSQLFGGQMDLDQATRNQQTGYATGALGQQQELGRSLMEGQLGQGRQDAMARLGLYGDTSQNLQNILAQGGGSQIAGLQSMLEPYLSYMGGKETMPPNYGQSFQNAANMMMQNSQGGGGGGGGGAWGAALGPLGAGIGGLATMGAGGLDPLTGMLLGNMFGSAGGGFFR